MADNLQTAIDYLNNSVKLLPNNPFKTELTKNSSNDDKFMALCYAMQQTYGLSLIGQMYQAPLIDLLSNNRIQTDIDQYYQSTIADSLNRAQIPKEAYSYQTEIEAINAVDSNHAWIIVSTHIKIDTKDETIKN